MIDFVKYSVPMLYSRNKSLAYRESIVESSVALLGFLKREGLILNDPFDEQGMLKMDFELRLSELSPEGVEMFKKIVPSWLLKNDRSGIHSDTSYLEKSLLKLRAG
ncbi:hypothetical protein [Pseudomonas putida]